MLKVNSQSHGRFYSLPNRLAGAAQPDFRSHRAGMGAGWTVSYRQSVVALGADPAECKLAMIRAIYRAMGLSLGLAVGAIPDRLAQHIGGPTRLSLNPATRWMPFRMGRSAYKPLPDRSESDYVWIWVCSTAIVYRLQAGLLQHQSGFLDAVQLSLALAGASNPHTHIFPIESWPIRIVLCLWTREERWTPSQRQCRSAVSCSCRNTRTRSVVR